MLVHPVGRENEQASRARIDLEIEIGKTRRGFRQRLFINAVEKGDCPTALAEEETRSITRRLLVRDRTRLLVNAVREGGYLTAWRRRKRVRSGTNSHVSAGCPTCNRTY